MRKKLVRGYGNRNARIMVVGEAPGTQEERAGVPFIGPSGELLNEWLGELGFSREDVFLTNLVKHKLPNNRKPTPEEIKAHAYLLNAEIADVDPDVILTLGVTASQSLVGVDKMESSAGVMYQKVLRNRPRMLVPFYHPSYVNRFGTEELRERVRERLAFLFQMLHEFGIKNDC